MTGEDYDYLAHDEVCSARRHPKTYFGCDAVVVLSSKPFPNHSDARRSREGRKQALDVRSVAGRVG